MATRTALDPGPHPGASSPELSRRMSRVRKRDNAPEMAVRRLLRAQGIGYRVCFKVPGQRRRTIDIAFPGPRLAVYLDGCFWHGCPLHCHVPKANRDWWTAKLAMNAARDAAVVEQLTGLGWTVLRFWEHEPAEDVVARIRTALGRPSLPAEMARADDGEPGSVPACAR